MLELALCEMKAKAVSHSLYTIGGRDWSKAGAQSRNAGDNIEEAIS